MKKFIVSLVASGLLMVGFVGLFHDYADESDYPDFLNPIEHNQ